MYNNVIKFLNEILPICSKLKAYETLKIKLNSDINKWYETDKEYNDNTFSNKSIPWPVIDIVKINMMRYGKYEPSLGIVLYYLDVLVSKYNVCL